MGRRLPAALLVALLPGGARAGEPSEEAYAAQRNEMVTTQIARRGVRDPEVLRALRTVPRHRFVPDVVRAQAYDDHPLPIGWDQTISQPYIVALMTELSGVGKGSRVLEVGTGSGYQAAVLAELGCEVYSIEIVEPLGRRARETLDATGYGSVKTRIGDGYRGWPEAAPFDAVLVTAAPEHVPEPLKEQLKVGGRLVLPVGGSLYQELTVIERTATSYRTLGRTPVRFVPMTGEAQEPQSP